MSEFGGDEATGARAPEQGDAYLSHWVAQAEQRRWSLPSHRDTVTIGRAPSTDVCLSGDAQVSRLHATMKRVDGQWTIKDDQSSRNGTFVNGHRLQHWVPLRDRDEIRVGGTVLTFHTPENASQQAVGGVGRQPPHRDGRRASPEARVQLLSVLLIAGVIESIGLVANGITTFAADRANGIVRWVVPPAIALLAAMAKALVDAASHERPARPESGYRAGVPPRRGGTPALAAVLVVLLVVGVGGFGLTVGVRYAAGYLTGKEPGTDRFIPPAAESSGGLTLTVNHVVYTRHFTRVDLTARNASDATMSLPVFGYCVFTGDDGTTLEADAFRSQWSTTLPPGALQDGTVTFGGKLPDGVTGASLSFSQVFGPRGGAITVRRIKLRPS